MSASSLRQVVAYLKIAIPEISWLITEINRDDGVIGFSTRLIDLITYDGYISWAHIYEDHQLLHGMLGVELVGEKRLRSLVSEFAGLTGDELERKKSRLRDEIFSKITEGKVGFMASADGRAPGEYINHLYQSPDERSDFVRQIRVLLPHIHQYLAIMTHGLSMVDLVAQAKAGDDKAFFKAVQIDRTVLCDIQYFSQRVLRAQLGNDPEFMNKLANAIKGKVLGHKFPHRKLWLTFSMLEAEGHLDIPLESLLDICTELNVHGGISDTNTLGKRRIQYLSRKGSQNKI